MAGLFRSTATIGSMTLISRILGFVRDMVLARVFGAGMATDAFFVAFKLPNFFRRMFGEGAFATAFVPIFTEYREHRSEHELRGLLAAVSGVLATVVAGVTLLGVLGAPYLVWVLAPGFGDQPEKLALTADLLRITFPYLFFISLVALAGGVLNTFSRFAAPAFTPVLLNVAMIVAAAVAAPYFAQPITALAWGVLAGGVLQFLFQWPFLRRIGMALWPRFRPGHAGVRRIVRLMGPSMLSVSVAQISILIDTILASLLAGGSVSYLYYADRLVQFPLGLFGIALGTAILPTLSRLVSNGRSQEYATTLDQALRTILTIGIPATAGLVLLGYPIIATLFQYGEFGAHATVRTYQALAAYAAGLVGFIGVKVLAPAYYAQQDTRTPVRVAVWALTANILLNLALIGPLAHAGLALATSLASFLNAGLLLRVLMARGLFRPEPGWALHLGKVTLSVAVMALTAWLVTPPQEVWDRASAWMRALNLFLVVGITGLTYLVAAWLLNVDGVRRVPRLLAVRLFDGGRGGR
ncbi:murein biosynthesis integral membrane protein MurJ [Thiohalorhabdus methylotrophus]|uniref:Probable lipid II flippase MurJ n=1 Tax=Thiohalorhabdus methylotrophus TaxID=3242694 RepID=A0ABV4TZ02_9GAMM